MRAYIAAPIFNEVQLDVVKEISSLIQRNGFDLFSPYEASRNIWKGRAPKDCSEAERKYVLEGNIVNLDCDLIVAWLGGTLNNKTDTGVVWELGFATALKRSRQIDPTLSLGARKPWILGYYHNPDELAALNLMLAGTIDALVVGSAQLYQALEMFATSQPLAAIALYHPAKAAKQEEEPIRA